MKMKWERAGVLIRPGVTWWAYTHVGPSFIRIDTSGNFDLFITGRCRDNISRIGVAKGLVLHNKLVVTDISSDPALATGEVGSFDEFGVSYPWVIRTDNNNELMYYVGWMRLCNNRFMNNTGLAIKRAEGAGFERYSRAPILGLCDGEPFGTGSCAVVETGPDEYGMLYTAFGPWRGDKHRDTIIPNYDIKYASSKDGIQWARTESKFLPLHDYEEVIGKPTITKLGSTYHLWFSARNKGERYQILHLSADDIKSYARSDEDLALGVSPTGWDSEMVEYAHVAEFKGTLFMIYNGNGFGKTGLGYATSYI